MQATYGMTFWFSLVAVIISQQALKRHTLCFSRWLERLTGAALIALGLRLAVTETKVIDSPLVSWQRADESPCGVSKSIAEDKSTREEHVY